jgi:hypothetical protein
MIAPIALLGLTLQDRLLTVLDIFWKRADEFCDLSQIVD